MVIIPSLPLLGGKTIFTGVWVRCETDYMYFCWCLLSQVHIYILSWRSCWWFSRASVCLEVMFFFISDLYWWYISWYWCSPRFRNCPLTCISCRLSSQQTVWRGRCYPCCMPFSEVHTYIITPFPERPYTGGFQKHKFWMPLPNDFLISRKFPNTILNTLSPP